MTEQTVMSLTYQALKLALTVAGPLLLATLAVGLLISIFQAATQINEMTLSFIPKLLTVGLVLVLLGPWLLTQLVDFFHHLLSSLPDLAQ